MEERNEWWPLSLSLSFLSVPPSAEDEVCNLQFKTRMREQRPSFRASLMSKPVNCSFKLRKCHFLFSCNTALALCSASRPTVFNATKQEATLLQPEGVIYRHALVPFHSGRRTLFTSLEDDLSGELAWSDGPSFWLWHHYWLTSDEISSSP